MLVIKVELWSAVSGQKTELARMVIANDETGNFKKRNYKCWTLFGRSKEQLDKSLLSGHKQRSGNVKDHASVNEHVWNLVAKCLTAMRYGSPGRGVI